MSITIDLDPGLQAALKDKADAAGLTLEQLALSLLERGAEKYHPKIEASLKIIEGFRGKIGPVREGALSAEPLYGDR